MSVELECTRGAAGEHDWEVVSTSADGHRERCRACGRERAEGHRFSAFFEPGIDFYTVVATRVKCGVCGYEAIL